MSNNKPYSLRLTKDLNTSLIETDNLNTLTITEDNIALNGLVSIGNSLYKLPNTSPASGSYLLTSDNSQNLSFTSSNPFVPNIITYYVSPLGNNTNNGSSVNQPFQTITYALTQINNIASNIKVCLTLLEGTYIENITISRPNLYITSNNLSTTSTIITGNITNSVASNTDIDNSLIGFTLNGSLTFNNSGSGAYNMLIGNITQYGTCVNNTTGISNYSIVFNNFTNIASGNNSNLVSYSGRMNLINANLSQDSANNTANLILINNGGLVMSNSIVISGNSTATAPSIIKFNNTVSIPYSNSFVNSQILYTSSTVNTGVDLQKVCINYNNSASLALNGILNCFFLCEGSRRNASGGKYDCVIKTGSASVVITYGSSVGGATANHIDTAITHIPYIALT
jgi:hypothetical protein